jgi:hypothetical protein
MIRSVAGHASGSRAAALAPLAVLLAYATVFGAAALGVSPLAFDDHPGQIYRLWHVIRLGPAPWAWNAGWWTGYPELQFYPPAFAYAGGLLHLVTRGALDVPATYHALVWLAYLLPGLTAWVLLRRAIGDGWLALPGAFVALTLSLWPTLTSGVEGGVHVGMVPARLGWAVLPVLAAALMRWADGGAAFPGRSVVPLVAAVILTHPAHVPAAAALVATTALAASGRARRLLVAATWLCLAALVSAFWTMPLLLRLADTRALAWGALTLTSLRDTVLAHPGVLALVALAAAAVALARSPSERALTWFPGAMAAVVALDAAVLEPAGLRWLPADRVLDGFWLALVLSAGLGGGRCLERLATRRALPRPVGALAAIAIAVTLSIAGDHTLTLWPRASLWASQASVERGVRMPALWDALAAAPAGRVLFVRSGVPLVYGRDWWRPHTHVTALTPLRAGRDVVNGTFTHPSPTAALVYRGDAGPAPIRELVERLDGRTLFGRSLESLDASTLNAHARRLRVSAVVALDEDLPRLAALADNPVFGTRHETPPFVIWLGPPAAVPEPLGNGRWRVTLDPGDGDSWASAGVAYYPLWSAAAAGTPVPMRRGALGDLEIRAPAGVTTVELTYAAGGVEWMGVGLSLAAALAWLAAAWRFRART